MGGVSAGWLLSISTALSFQIVQRLSTSEVELLAAFLEVLGDQLALLALQMPVDEGTNSNTQTSTAQTTSNSSACKQCRNHSNHET